MTENGKEMCVTGGTGFIAGFLIRALLNKGYSVRTTVRNPDNVEKVGYLWDLPGAKQRLKIVKADLVDEGSFDEAVNGVDGVFHTACPVVVPNDHNIKTFLDPAVNGTLNVFKSCSRSPSVKRVVLTSSCSAIRYNYNTQELSPLDESHWSNPEYCKQYNLWYAYAKTTSEKEAWKYAEEQRLDLVVVNPSFVVGPLIAPEPTSTLDFILNIIKGGNNRTYPNFRVGFVDIGDVISAHILAMEAPSASGRIICSGDVAHWEEIVKMLKEKYPMYPIADQCGTEQGNALPHTMNTAKIRSLGFGNFKSIDQMFEDCIRNFQEKGLL
ncbi:tetraketide alpha-pyrone reductase 2 isoform X2 [Cryptomeria japonica]|uniref:Cinnamoyl-CoA reductase n=1 Tax=Cryptomeria japonica var. sinensis TaxID=99810 RepID=A0A801UM43_CRYJA|nr:tetraketide alpha-pyrone reductase 2 isoform X2 [Cryptomeria japonica]QDC33554.1 cinnamoyl-CoA reductase [Cryptomeria japonica var. sinensis]